MVDDPQAVHFTVVQLISWGIGVFLAFVGQGVGLVIVFARYLGARFAENTAALNSHATAFEGRLETLRRDVVAELKHLTEKLTTTIVGHERLEARVDGLSERVRSVENGRARVPPATNSTSNR